MTKKSEGRQRRDAIAKAAAEHQASWDEVNDLGNNCSLLLAMHAGIGPLAQNAALMAKVRDPALLAKNLRILASDLTALNAELQLIKVCHAGKTGSATTPDENMEAISIYEKYVLFNERHESLIMPVSNHITEQFREAEALLNQVSNLTPEQDPNVITDLEVKESA